MKEVCLCAAVKTVDGYVIRGHRHSDCIRHLKYHKGAVQGFLTSNNRFVDREEGYKLQKSAEIKSIADGGYRGEKLYSEDLY